MDFTKLDVLVIDDESFMRKLIIRILNELGTTRVVEAGDGQDGLEKVQNAKKSFDIILCDLEMPVMDGLKFVETLRARVNPALRDIPVLVVTGHSDEENVYDAVALGINGFLVKPISKQALESRMAAAIKNPQVNPAVLKC